MEILTRGLCAGYLEFLKIPIPISSSSVLKPLQIMYRNEVDKFLYTFYSLDKQHSKALNHMVAYDINNKEMMLSPEDAMLPLSNPEHYNYTELFKKSITFNLNDDLIYISKKLEDVHFFRISNDVHGNKQRVYYLPSPNAKINTQVDIINQKKLIKLKHYVI
jgi:hypothetical protein